MSASVCAETVVDEEVSSLLDTRPPCVNKCWVMKMVVVSSMKGTPSFGFLEGKIKALALHGVIAYPEPIHFAK